MDDLILLGELLAGLFTKLEGEECPSQFALCINTVPPPTTANPAVTSAYKPSMIELFKGALVKGDCGKVSLTLAIDTSSFSDTDWISDSNGEYHNINDLIGIGKVPEATYKLDVEGKTRINFDGLEIVAIDDLSGVIPVKFAGAKKVLTTDNTLIVSGISDFGTGHSISFGHLQTDGTTLYGIVKVVGSEMKVKNDARILVETDQALEVDATQGLRVPRWTTALRPTTPDTGIMGFNTDLTIFEGWNGTAWVPIS